MDISVTPNPAVTGGAVVVTADNLTWEATEAVVRSDIFQNPSHWYPMTLRQEWDRKTASVRLPVPLGVSAGSHRVEVKQSWVGGGEEPDTTSVTVTAGEFALAYSPRFVKWESGPNGRPVVELAWESNDPKATGKVWVHGWNSMNIGAGSGRIQVALQLAYGIENGRTITAKLELTSSTGVTKHASVEVQVPSRPGAATAETFVLAATELEMADAVV